MASFVRQVEEDACKLFPSMEGLKTFENRLLENRAWRAAGIDTAEFWAGNSLTDLHQAIDQLGLPLVLKTTTEGYDGKGQFVIKQADQAQQAWDSIGQRELIAEAFVTFERETSVIASRDQNGHMVVWPMPENVPH